MALTIVAFVAQGARKILHPIHALILDVSRQITVILVVFVAVEADERPLLPVDGAQHAEHFGRERDVAAPTSAPGGHRSQHRRICKRKETNVSEVRSPDSDERGYCRWGL